MAAELAQCAHSSSALTADPSGDTGIGKIRKFDSYVPNPRKITVDRNHKALTL